MKWEEYLALAKKYAEQLKTTNRALANALLSLSKGKFKDAEEFKNYIGRVQEKVVGIADKKLDEEIIRMDSDRLPSESVLEHLNVLSFLRQMRLHVPNGKEDPKRVKMLEEQMGKPYGFFFAADPAYAEYYQKMEAMRSAGKNTLTMDDYRRQDGNKGLLFLADGCQQKNNKSIALRKNPIIKNLIDRVFSEYDHSVLQITRPTGSNKKVANEIVSNNTFGEVIKKGRNVLARNIAFQNHNPFLLDRFFYAMNGYIQDGHPLEAIQNPEELNVILFQIADIDFTDFNPANGTTAYEFRSFCDYMQDLISDPEQYDAKTQKKLGDRMSLASRNFLSRPAVKKALLQLKRDPADDLKFVRDIFAVLEDNGLSAMMDDLAKHTTREPGNFSMAAIQQTAARNRSNPNVPFLGVAMVDQLKDYVHELALRGASHGLRAKAPVKKIDGEDVPEEWQELEAYVPGCMNYMQRYNEYIKNPTQATAYNFSFAAGELSKSIGTIFGDDQLMADLKQDSDYAYKHSDALKLQERTGRKPALGSASEVKEYYMMDDRLRRIPSLFERALCNLGIWLKHHSLDELTDEVLNNLNSNLLHGFNIPDKGELLLRGHDTLRRTLESGIVGLPEYFINLKEEYRNEPFSPEVASALKTLLKPEWRTESCINDLGRLKNVLGEMQKADLFNLALKSNDKYLNLQVPSEEDQNALLLLERCKKLFSDPAYVKSLTDNLYFRNAWEMAEGHDFNDFLARLNAPDLLKTPFTLTKEISLLVAEARRSMSIAFSSSLDAQEKDLRQLFDIMMQIKMPEKHFNFDDKVSAREFMEMTDILCESPLSAQLDPIIEDFNSELALASKEDRMKKVSKNVYETKDDSGVHSFAEFAKLIFVNGTQNSLPYTLKDAWKMEDYNKVGSNKVMSENECVYQTLMRYKQLANYLPYLGKLYTRDQNNIKGVSLKEINEHPEKYRTGNFIMSNVVNLQAHETMNSPAVEARFAAYVISILGSEFKATVGDPKLRQEFYKALSDNVCFDERASNFTQFSAKRRAVQGTPAQVPEDGSLYFKTDEMEQFVRVQASSADNLMQAVLAIANNLKDEYSDSIPFENITVDMVRPAMKRILVDGKLEIENAQVTEKNLDNMLETLRSMGIFRDPYDNDAELRNTILNEMKGAGYVWNASWDEATEQQAMEHARRLLGFHRVPDWATKETRFLEELAGMPTAEIRKEQRKNQNNTKVNGPVNRGFANNASRRRMEENLRRAEVEAQRNRWREMEGGNGVREAEARNLKYGTGTRYNSFQQLFKKLIEEIGLKDSVPMFGSRRLQNALRHIQDVMKLSKEDFANIFVNAGTVQEADLVAAAQQLMQFYEERYIFGQEHYPDSYYNNSALFEKALPEKRHQYSDENETFKYPNDQANVQLKNLIQRFKQALPAFNLQDAGAGQVLLERLEGMQRKLDYMVQHDMRIEREEALDLCEAVHGCTALMMVYMNPADRPEQEWKALQKETDAIFEGLEFKVGKYQEDFPFMRLHFDLNAVTRLAGALHQAPDQSVGDNQDMLTWLRDRNLHYIIAREYLRNVAKINLDTDALDELDKDIKRSNENEVRAENIRQAFDRFEQLNKNEKQNSQEEQRIRAEIAANRAQQAAEFRKNQGELLSHFKNTKEMQNYLNDFVRMMKQVRKQVNTLYMDSQFQGFLDVFDENMKKVDICMSLAGNNNADSVVQAFSMVVGMLDAIRQEGIRYASAVDMATQREIKCINLSALHRLDLLDEKLRQGISVTTESTARELIAMKLLAYINFTNLQDSKAEVKANGRRYFTDAAYRKNQFDEMLKDRYFDVVIKKAAASKKDLEKMRDGHSNYDVYDNYSFERNRILRREAREKEQAEKERLEKEQAEKEQAAQEEAVNEEAAKEKEAPKADNVAKPEEAQPKVEDAAKQQEEQPKVENVAKPEEEQPKVEEAPKVENVAKQQEEQPKVENVAKQQEEQPKVENEVKPEDAPKADNLVMQEKLPEADNVVMQEEQPKEQKTGITREVYSHYVHQFNLLKKELLDLDAGAVGSESYFKLKRVVNRWSNQFTSEMETRMQRGAEPTAMDVKILCDALRNVSLAGEDYIKAHTPKNGNLKKASLSSTQQQRLSIINRFRQLKQLAMPGNENYVADNREFPDPNSMEFTKKRIALKVVNALAIRSLKNGVNVEAAKDILLAENNDYRDLKMKELSADPVFNKMLMDGINQIHSKHRQEEKKAIKEGKPPKNYSYTMLEGMQYLARVKPDTLYSLYDRKALEMPKAQEKTNVKKDKKLFVNEAKAGLQ